MYKGKKRYWELKEKGICNACGSKTENGHSKCNACLEKQRTKDKERKERFLSQGICYRCKERKVVQGKSKCETCFEEEREIKREYYKKNPTRIDPQISRENNRRFIRKRKDNGLCVRCGNPLDRDGILCIKCNSERNEQDRSDRKFYLEIGICPVCKKESVEPNKKMCFECAEYSRITSHNNAYKDREKFLEKNREYQKSYYQKRKEAGICIRCKNKADPGYTTCGRCRVLKVNAPKKKAQMKRTDRWKLGLCYFCDEQVKTGYKVCEKHWKMNCEKTKLCPPEVKKHITNRIFGRSDF